MFNPVGAPIASLVPSADGTEIHFDFYPRLSADSLVLIVPGFWRTRDHPSMRRLAALVVGLGYNAAVIDIRGHGQSGGTYGFNFHEHEDVSAVANALLQQHDLRKVAMIGLSMGGAIAVATAVRHKLPWSSLMLISPVAKLSWIRPRLSPLTMHRHIAFSQAFARPRVGWHSLRDKKIVALDEVSALDIPMCLIHVEDDWLVGHRHSLALYERAREPKELHLLDIPGRYHADRIFSVAPERIEPILTEFLARTLGAGQTKEAAISAAPLEKSF